jgi:hypothetical protein
MPNRRKPIAPGMQVRVARPAVGGTWLHEAFAEARVAGTVVGPGWGDCWRVVFPASIRQAKPLTLAFAGKHLIRLGERKARPMIVEVRLRAPDPGSVVSRTV